MNFDDGDDNHNNGKINTNNNSDLLLFKSQPKGFSTKAIHNGQNTGNWNSKAVVPPIITSTTFQQTDINEYEYEYGRCGNPTKTVLETCLSSLDNAHYGLVFSAGLGALTTIGHLFESGDHIISSNKIFGGSLRYFKEISEEKQKIEIDFVDLENLNNLRNAIKSTTRMIWLESPTNPTMSIIDIQAVAEIAHSHDNLILVVDNTFLTSYFQRPLELAADMVMYSLTKFMNGHTDVIMGAITTNSEQLYKRLQSLQIVMGTIPSPFDCYQINRSLKTLALRMEKHHENSLAIAKYLETHRAVEKIYHPGLASHPQRELARKQSYGHSGMIALHIHGGQRESRTFLKSIKLIRLATSLGGPESLAQYPYLMTHGCVPESEKLKLGITQNLIRLSIGLEDADDLIDDLNQALNRSQII